MPRQQLPVRCTHRAVSAQHDGAAQRGVAPMAGGVCPLSRVAVRLQRGGRVVRPHVRQGGRQQKALRRRKQRGAKRGGKAKKRDARTRA